jgi:hypothetical protein
VGGRWSESLLWKLLRHLRFLPRLRQQAIHLGDNLADVERVAPEECLRGDRVVFAKNADLLLAKRPKHLQRSDVHRCDDGSLIPPTSGRVVRRSARGVAHCGPKKWRRIVDPNALPKPFPQRSLFGAGADTPVRVAVCRDHGGRAEARLHEGNPSTLGARAPRQMHDNLHTRRT